MVGAMSEMSFGDAEYAGKRKQTRREISLAEMEQVVPWKSLLDLISPFYPEAGGGRHPYPLPTMLRVHLMQNWFGLSDPAMEEALYEITPVRLFAGLSLDKPIPDETTILNNKRRDKRRGQVSTRDGARSCPLPACFQASASVRDDRRRRVVSPSACSPQQSQGSSLAFCLAGDIESAALRAAWT
jgi:hypothetical protein